MNVHRDTSARSIIALRGQETERVKCHSLNGSAFKCRPKTQVIQTVGSVTVPRYIVPTSLAPQVTRRRSIRIDLAGMIERTWKAV